MHRFYARGKVGNLFLRLFWSVGIFIIFITLLQFPGGTTHLLADQLPDASAAGTVDARAGDQCTVRADADVLWSFDARETGDVVTEGLALTGSGLSLKMSLGGLAMDPTFEAVSPSDAEELAFYDARVCSVVRDALGVSLFSSATDLAGRSVIVVSREDASSGEWYTTGISGLDSNNAIWSPAVVYVVDHYEMLYLSAPDRNGSGAIEYASSYDGLHWYASDSRSADMWMDPGGISGSWEWLRLCSYEHRAYALLGSSGNTSLFGKELDRVGNEWVSIQGSGGAAISGVSTGSSCGLVDGKLVIMGPSGNCGSLTLHELEIVGDSISGDRVSNCTLDAGDVRAVALSPDPYSGGVYLARSMEGSISIERAVATRMQRGSMLLSGIVLDDNELELELDGAVPVGCSVDAELRNGGGEIVFGAAAGGNTFPVGSPGVFSAELGVPGQGTYSLELILHSDSDASPVVSGLSIRCIVHMPDLAISSFSPMETAPVPLNTSGVNITVVNRGQGPVDRKVVLETCMDGSRIDMRSIGPIPVGGTIEVSVPYLALDGHHRFETVVDASELIVEENRSDNRAVFEMDIGEGSDIFFDGHVVLSHTVFSVGELVNVTLTVGQTLIQDSGYDLSVLVGGTLFVQRNIVQHTLTYAHSFTWMVDTPPSGIPVTAALDNITVEDRCASNNRLQEHLSFDQPPGVVQDHIDLTINEDSSNEGIIDARELFTDDGLLVYGISSTSNIVASVDSRGSVSLWPAANWWGTDDLRLTCTDAVGHGAVVLLTVNVLPVNDPPRFVADTFELMTRSNMTTLDLSRSVVDVDTPLSGLVLTSDDGVEVNGLIATFRASSTELCKSYHLILSDGEGIDQADVVIRSPPSAFITILSPVGGELTAGDEVELRAISSVPYDRIIAASWYLNGHLLGQGMNTNAVVPEGSVGECTLEMRIESYSGDTNVSRTVVVRAAPGNGEGGSGGVPVPPPSLVGGTLVVATALGMSSWWALGTKGRWRLLGLLLGPLYSQLKKEDVVSQTTRKQILDYIRVNEGANFNMIKKALGFNNGTLSYHLAVLEKNSLISSHSAGKFRLFYTEGYGLLTVLKGFSTTQRKIIYAIDRNPGITQKELSEEVGLSRPTTCKNLKHIQGKQIVKTVIRGNFRHYYIREENTSDHWTVINKKGIRLSSYEELEMRWKEEAIKGIAQAEVSLKPIVQGAGGSKVE